MDNQVNYSVSIQFNKFEAIIKPNSKENKIINFNKDNNTYKIRIKAKPERQQSQY